MPRPSIARHGAAWLALVLPTTSCGSPVERPDHAPVVAGLAEAEFEPIVRGRVLLGELGCTNCHADPDGLAEARPAPDLQTVGARVRGDYLRHYLASPLHVEPGTAMPDLLRAVDGSTARDTADSLASYLQSFATAVLDDVPADAAAVAPGQQLWDTLGCRACHDQNPAGMHNLRDKYTIASLQAFLLAPHRARPAARMPEFELSPTEANALANHLLRDPASSVPAQPSTAAAVEAGRAHFAELGCGNCHQLEDAARPASKQARPLAELDASAGCLSGTVGAWPYYALDQRQRQDLALALQGNPLAGEARIRQQLASRNCIACHVRGEIDLLDAHADRFDSHDPTLGPEGRVPPPLTGVGAKLQRAWLGNTIAHGQHERPYLKTRMPGFGVAFAERLADDLAATDTLEPVAIAPLPADRKQADEVVKLGQQLAGDKGMGCIACHLFAGEQGGSMAGIDLLHSTGERLRPEWFVHFMKDPFAFKPGTLMPQFFPGGTSTRPELADGDVDAQLAGLWHYLAKGRNVRKPSGLRRPPIELTVADEAVMLRRAVQNTGKRGISVGYPGGVNLTFDAETLVLNQIWWGRFVDARPVWTSQGSGQAHVLERRRARLPLQPQFAPSNVAQASWPATTRRERGDRWLGYDLDAQQRPSFRYTCCDVQITDTPRERRDGEATVLERTMQLVGDGQLVLRLARDENLKLVDEHTALVGGFLLVRCAQSPLLLVEDGKHREVRVAVTATAAGTELQVDYRRQEDK
ncbi:MAG: hypothetical protein ACE37K_21550 [Planctomycetota bacterium]